MVVKTRSKTRSMSEPKGSQAATKPLAPAREKPVTKRAPKPETSRKRARIAKVDPEIPSEPEPGSLMRLPLELIIEIAKQLHPFNLILLSRTNKYFRHHLMSRSAIRIWQSSLRTVEDLPPCPENLCEPKYAALLFVGECSTCGEVTSRTMDPLLLVRLCVKCDRKQVAHISKFSFAGIQLISTGNIVHARRGKVQRVWCLSREAKNIETEYKRLLNGVRRERNDWISKRWDDMQERHAVAQSIREWAKGKELDGFKSARKADIEARLAKLGWERVDFRPEEPWRPRQWTSLVYNAKPMDDQVWEELSPRLLEHLEANRRIRLRREADERESARIHMLYEYMGSLKMQLQPLVKAKLKSQTASAGTDHSEHWSPRFYRLGRRSQFLFPLFPRTRDHNFCPESTALIQTDMSMETFELEFPAKTAQIPQLIDEARAAFEDHLVQMLPNDTQPVDIQGTEFDLVTGTGESDQSLDVLPLGIRKLLRADAVFKDGPKWRFYPTSFSWHDDASKLVYDPNAASLVRSLLNTLGRPNASHLEMEALGWSFVCGRCKSRQIYYTWTHLITHYRREELEWQRQSERVARNLKDGDTFTLVFTHDTGCIDSNKPLVRLVHEWIDPGPIEHPSQKCKLCDSVGLSCIQAGGYIADHVRDVHLINDPVEGVHYESVNS